MRSLILTSLSGALLLLGCGNGHDHNIDNSMSLHKNETMLRNLQSITCVQIHTYNLMGLPDNSLQAKTTQLLREFIPELHTDDRANSWTLEITFNYLLAPNLLSSTGITEPTPTCTLRLWKQCVVEKRLVNAIAYETHAVASRTTVANKGHTNEHDLLKIVLVSFSKQWHHDNATQE
ncbi:MAG: hypothetical protein JXM70_09435 [Pirellulales bacterium]|nr:hypothetical protein [Pirellulales bacterium]